MGDSPAPNWGNVSHQGSTQPKGSHTERDKHSYEATIKRIEGLKDPHDELKLTPLRAHYLKKALVKLQLQQEVELLSEKGALRTSHAKLCMH